MYSEKRWITGNVAPTCAVTMAAILKVRKRIARSLCCCVHDATNTMLSIFMIHARVDSSKFGIIKVEIIGSNLVPNIATN